MPIKPKRVDRPWIQQVDYSKLPGQGRKFVPVKFYKSAAWRNLRHKFITGISTHLNTPNPHPNAICIDCIKRGIITATHTIDHIKPINPINPYDTMKERYGEPLTWENLQPLCESCNGSKTAKQKYNIEG